jgi:hypothetical protein
MSNFAAAQLPLAPLGAGDLIDRAVRLYRRHLSTLMRIGAPPVIVSAAGSVLFSVASRKMFTAPDSAMLALYLLLTVVGLITVVSGHLFSLIVMGGAARNLVMHLLWSEPVSVRTTYAAVRSRFWALLGASLIMVMWFGLSVMVAVFGGYTILTLIAFPGIVVMQVAPIWLSVLFWIAGFIVSTVIGLWLFFFLIGRMAYVPQVLLVEGKGVFASVGRSFSLAKGNVRRLMAMTLFITFAFYSALMILVAPLVWYGYLNGVSLSPWDASEWPTWYAVAYSVLGPVSSILLAPIWMLGLSLLYVDERVRHEGYDIELMAARQLVSVPKQNVVSPYAPAIVLDPETIAPPPHATGSVLGLN